MASDKLKIYQRPNLRNSRLLLGFSGWMDGGEVSTGTIRYLIDKLAASDVTEEKMAAIRSICQHHRGRSPVYVSVQTDKGRVYAAADKELSVNLDLDFCRKMRQLLGEENFQLTR